MGSDLDGWPQGGGPRASASPLVGRAGFQDLWVWALGNPRADVRLLVGTAEAWGVPGLVPLPSDH